MNYTNKARKPIVILGLLTLFISLISVTVMAAYIYTRSITEDDVTIGDVTVDSKNYLTYAKYPTDASIVSAGITVMNDDKIVKNEKYYIAKKMRIDTLCILDGFQMKASYREVTISAFAPNVTYYTFDDVTGIYSRAITYVAGTQYYVASYVLNTVKSAYDIDVNKLNVAISSNTLTVTDDSNNTVVIVEVTIDTSTGLLSSIVSVKKSNSVNGNLRAIIGSDNLSITIIDDDLITESNKPSEIQNVDNNVTCFASYRNKDDSRIDYDSPYLNQLGLEFEFTVNVPVYVRIHIQDAWVSTQFLSSKSERVRYVSKDKISGSSPFSIDDPNWYYDSANNIAYYRQMFMPTEQNGNFTSQNFIFNVNEGYYYYDKSAQAAQKITEVQVSFTVDIVQANRAEKLWDVDFSELFGE